jgi:hypothetical protein
VSFADEVVVDEKVARRVKGKVRVEGNSRGCQRISGGRDARIELYLGMPIISLYSNVGDVPRQRRMLRLLLLHR